MSKNLVPSPFRPLTRKILEWSRFLLWRSTSSRRLRQKIDDFRKLGLPVKIQVGAAGHKIDGWLATDILPSADYYLDGTKMVEVPTAAVDFIFAEHFIEHLTLEQAKLFTSEAARTLKPGAMLRLATPDLKALATGYTSESSSHRALVTALNGRGDRHFGQHSATAINQQMFSWGHRFLHDRESLTAILRDAGFDEVETFGLGKGSVPELMSIEQHELGTALDPFMLVIEARRVTLS